MYYHTVYSIILQAIYSEKNQFWVIPSYYLHLVLKCRSNACFDFMFECSRWGPTSLQTVKMNEREFYTVCT